MVAVGNILSVLVVGATGNTGKHVVRQLLDQGHKVNVIAHSKQRMLEVLPASTKNDSSKDGELLTVTEASLLDMSDHDLEDSVRNADAVVSCLGHNMSFKGIFGAPRKLVTEATQRLTEAMIKTSKETKDETATPKKFILMGSDGVAHPDGTDDPRTTMERFILFLLRNLIPPHADNEGAAAHINNVVGRESGIQWTVLRPTDLIDGDATPYNLFDKPIGGLFGAGVATRATVAKCMVDMITESKLWEQYKYQHPVIHNATPESETPQGKEL